MEDGTLKKVDISLVLCPSDPKILLYVLQWHPAAKQTDKAMLEFLHSRKIIFFFPLSTAPSTLGSLATSKFKIEDQVSLSYLRR